MKQGAHKKSWDESIWNEAEIEGFMLSTSLFWSIACLSFLNCLSM